MNQQMGSDNLDKQKIIHFIVTLLLSVALFFSSGLKIPELDTHTEDYFRDSISKAGLSYAICRIVNGTVSVVKESSIELEPGGIGMSLAIGQLADPINDMVERLSNLLVMAISSLGVQELTYQIGLVLTPALLSVFFLIISVFTWIENERLKKVRDVAISLSLIVLVARFCLPISSLANDFLQRAFFEEKISTANADLNRCLTGIDSFEKMEIPDKEGWLQSIESNALSLKQKTKEFKTVLASITQNRDLIIESLLRLMFLYLGIFIIQILILPLISFWVMMKILQAFLSRPS